jgi:hypothetical protein
MIERAMAKGAGLRTAATAVGVGAALGAALLAAPRRAEPGMPLDDETRLRHLIRRAAFGATGPDLAEYRRLGLGGTVDRLVDYESTPDDFDARIGDILSFDKTKLNDVQRRWLMRMVWSKRPLQEKMTLFWHGLLTSANAKVGRPELMERQNELFREHALADYGTLLKAVSRDPAMMLWLDTHNSRRAAPNENYARELMELFSMGVGHYTETDVRQAARAFTGWTVTKEGLPTFTRFQFDDGEKRFLGTTVKTGDDVVDAIVAQPATSQFIAGKLFAFFVHPAPTPADIEPFARVFRETGGSIRAVVRAILTSEAFYSPAAYRSRLKSPVEYVVGTMRQLGIPTEGTGVIERLVRMGQQLYNPPNVAGWPGGRSWLNSGTWIERLNFANAVSSKQGDGRILSWQAGRFLDDHGLTRADDAVDHLLDLLVDGRAGPESRRVLEQYLGVPPGTDLARSAALDGKLRGVLYLILAMPEHQLC